MIFRRVLSHRQVLTVHGVCGIDVVFVGCASSLERRAAKDVGVEGGESKL